LAGNKHQVDSRPKLVEYSLWIPEDSLNKFHAHAHRHVATQAKDEDLGVELIHVPDDNHRDMNLIEILKDSP
jgi:hypothetical protein